MIRFIFSLGVGFFFPGRRGKKELYFFVAAFIVVVLRVRAVGMWVCVCVFFFSSFLPAWHLWGG